MKREIIHVHPVSDYLAKYKAPVSAVTRYGDMIYVSGCPPSDPATGQIAKATIERPNRTCFGTDEALPRSCRIIS